MLPFFYFCCMDFMQTDLGTLIRNAKILKEASAWINSFSVDVKNQIIYFIQKEQLFDEGVDGNNQVIGYYKPFTEQLNPLKKAGEHFTLFDTGEFYKSMYIVVLQDSFIVEANGDKSGENLFLKYGDDIIGLTDLSKEKLAEILTEKYIKYVSEILSIG